MDASGLEDAVRLLLDARTVTSIMFDCESRESLTYLEASDWTIAGARCHSRDDLGADLELRWPA